MATPDSVGPQSAHAVPSASAADDSAALSRARPDIATATATGRRLFKLPPASGAFWLLSALTLGCAFLLSRPPPALPLLRPVAVPACPVPVEVPGHGVRCLAAQEAGVLGLAPGDIWPPGPGAERAAGPPRRMAPRRLLAVGVRLDPQTATAAELEALPEIGPGLARRIIETRQQRAARGEPPLARRADLLQISGLGERRLKRLLPFLIPLP